jgi:hypothetical protein
VFRRYILLAAAAASVWGFSSAAEARCQVNLDTCVEGTCTVNAGDCTRGSCTVNLPGADCTEGSQCLVNVTTCDQDPTAIPDVLLCPVFKQAGPGVAGVVEFDSEGDVTVAGTDFWNCPPYDS